MVYTGRPGSGGPDYRDAVLKIDGRRLCGSVEFHLHTADWMRHRHQHNPGYDDVILHVVGSGSERALTSGGREIPLVAVGVYTVTPALTPSFPCLSYTPREKLKAITTASRARLWLKATGFLKRLNPSAPGHRAGCRPSPRAWLCP